MLKKSHAFVIMSLVLMTPLVACQNTEKTEPAEINYELDERNLTVDEVVIPYYLIDNIEDVPVIPDMEKIEGTETGNYRKGLFELEGIGPVHVFIQDNNRKMLLIEHDEQYFGITPGTGQEFDTFRYNLIVAWELTYK